MSPPGPPDPDAVSEQEPAPPMPPVRVHEVMSPQTARVRPTDTIRIAALVMRLRDVGFLPVVHEGQVVGVLTDRDLTIRAIASGLDPWTTSVERVMTIDVFYCFDDEEVAAAANLMESEGVRRLVVFDRKMRLVGVLSLDDLSAIPGAARRVGQTLRQLS